MCPRRRRSGMPQRGSVTRELRDGTFGAHRRKVDGGHRGTRPRVVAGLVVDGQIGLTSPHGGSVDGRQLAVTRKRHRLGCRPEILRSTSDRSLHRPTRGGTVRVQRRRQASR